MAVEHNAQVLFTETGFSSWETLSDKNDPNIGTRGISYNAMRQNTYVEHTFIYFNQAASAYGLFC